MEKAIPVGIGGGLEKNKKTIPVYQVDNVVEYVNPDIQSPFDLKEGVETNLGLFLSNTPKEGETVRNVELQKYHGRAGLLGRVIIQDNEGRKYRDVDIKGLGYLSDKTIFSFSGTPGILNYEAAIKEKNVSEEMLKLGLNSSRVLSIIRLNEIFDNNGDRISVEQARQNRIIRETDEPVVEVRLMGSNARIQDLRIKFDHDPENFGSYRDNWRRYDLTLKDIIEIISNELGVESSNFSLNDYVNWFAENLGRQIAIMHRNGWIHTGLTEQNITLDGKIVDFATAEHYSQNPPTTEDLKKWVKYSRDIDRAARSLRRLYNYIFIDQKPDEEKPDFYQLVGKFKNTYIKNLGLDKNGEQEFMPILERDIESGIEYN